MSLRNFHIFFILTAMALLAFLVYWSGQRLLSGQDGFNKLLCVSSAASLLIGIPYLAWFIRKTKTL